MANFSDILNALGEVSLYAQNPDWKRKREAEIRAQSLSDAQRGLIEAQTKALPEKADIQHRRDFLSLARMAAANVQTPEQGQALVDSAPPELQGAVMGLIQGAAAYNRAKKENVEAGTGEKTAGAEKTKAETPEPGQVPRKIESQIDLNKAAAERARRGPAGPKAPTVIQLQKEIAAGMEDLRRAERARDLGDSTDSFEAAVEAAKARIESAKRQLAGIQGGGALAGILPRGVPTPSELLAQLGSFPKVSGGKAGRSALPPPVDAPSKASTGFEIVLPGGVRLKGAADAKENAAAVRALASRLRPEKRARLLEGLEKLGVPNPEGFLSGR